MNGLSGAMSVANQVHETALEAAVARAFDDVRQLFSRNGWLRFKYQCDITLPIV